MIKKSVIISLLFLIMFSTTVLGLLGDVDGDNDVDILDLILVARNIGKIDFISAANVNDDNQVGILDLIIVARNMGKVDEVNINQNDCSACQSWTGGECGGSCKSWQRQETRTGCPLGVSCQISRCNSDLSCGEPPAIDKFNPPYPRTAIFQWGGAVAEWYARFDLVLTRRNSNGFIEQVKQINPHVLWLPMRDFNISIY